MFLVLVWSREFTVHLYTESFNDQPTVFAFFKLGDDVVIRKTIAWLCTASVSPVVEGARGSNCSSLAWRQCACALMLLIATMWLKKLLCDVMLRFYAKSDNRWDVKKKKKKIATNFKHYGTVGPLLERDGRLNLQWTLENAKRCHLMSRNIRTVLHLHDILKTSVSSQKNSHQCAH